MKKMRDLAVCLSIILAFSIIPALSVSANVYTGNAVYAAQYLLQNAGYNPGVIDGAYGDNTQNAIIAFQSANGLNPSDGIVGVNTWAKLTAGVTVGSGSSGNAVYAAQYLLLNAGYSPGTIDGAYGTNTKNAIMAFQSAKGLTPSDGIVGVNTWAKLTAGVTVGISASATSSTVVTYSLNADGSKYITTNFQVKEFACKDGTDTILIDTALAQRLQKIRDYFGKSVTIVSGYRTAAYNSSINGAKDSYHIKGQAADISISGVSRSQIRAYANSIGLSCEIYNTDNPNTAGLTQHVDTRDISSPYNFHE
ncbi:MAG: peptidoglycan-binding protein [Firmicutes bacterium]|nr:peptidoglycan-binding protein [Bacillota bacterium]